MKTFVELKSIHNHHQSSFSLNWRRKAKPKVTMSIEQAQKIKLVLIHTIPHTTKNYSYIQPCHLAGDWRLLLPLLASTFEFFSISSIVLPLMLKSILQPTRLDLTSGFQCYDTFQQPFFIIGIITLIWFVFDNLRWNHYEIKEQISKDLISPLKVFYKRFNVKYITYSVHKKSVLEMRNGNLVSFLSFHSWLRCRHLWKAKALS